ncbi:MAG: Crp/Fnr family transcriptional regulator, partial [Stellaceae bacterium]
IGVLVAATRRNPILRDLLLGYVRFFLVQVLQSVACNGLHSVRQRCARWLLMAHDRAGTDTFGLTNQFLADMLGIQRPSVTVVARSLQQAGLIDYRRGTITIADRKRLEGAACECYAIVHRALDDILKRPAGTKAKRHRA